MSATLKSRSRGYSLVELMVAIFVMAILMGIAVPSFQAWMQNSQIRNAAESIQNGLQRARAEAVARNANVEFVLGADSSWVVKLVGGADIDARPASESSKNVTRTALAADWPLTTPPTFNNSTPATTVTFNNFGSAVVSATQLARVDLVAVGGTQNLRVTIGVGGNVRMCDPNAPSGSSRAC